MILEAGKLGTMQLHLVRDGFQQETTGQWDMCNGDTTQHNATQGAFSFITPSQQLFQYTDNGINKLPLKSPTAWMTNAFQ